VRLLLDDLRYAWRQLRRTPGFTFVAVLTLALGIGATTAIFGAVSALLLKPDALRIEDVFRVYSKYPGERGGTIEMQRADFRALEANRPASLVATAAVEPRGCIAQIPGFAESTVCEDVTLGYPDVFRVEAAAGRWFLQEDERPMGGDTAVISERLWRQWFAGDRTIVGTMSIRVAYQRRRVVGVAPPGFRGDSRNTDVWVLQPTNVAAFKPPVWWKQPRPPGVRTYVRARSGASPDEIKAQISSTVAATSPGPEAARTIFGVLDGRSFNPAGTLAYWILAFAVLVFVAACANLANMLYARGTQRAGEIAVRLSLGASRARIIRLFVAEAALIAGVAATAGLGIAAGLTRWFSAAFPVLNVSRRLGARMETTFELDGRVFLFAFVLGAAAALFVGLTTAWRLSRAASLRPVLAAGATGAVAIPARGLQTSLVSIQITAAVLLVLAATMFLENTRKAYDQRVTYESARLTAANVQLPGYEMDSTGMPVPAYTESRGRQFFERLLERARQLPDVEAAALTVALPGAGPRSHLGCFRAEDEDGVTREVVRRADGATVIVSPDMLKIMGVHTSRGRDLASADVFGGPPVGVVTESVAQRLWPNADPIGKRMYECTGRTWLTVVGVSANLAVNGATPVSQVFVPFDQRYQGQMMLVVRSSRPAAQVDAVRALVSGLDPEVAIFEVAPVDDLLLAGVALQRATRTLALSLGGLALAIAVLGVYGVVAYFVSRRTREFGLRLALGATRGQVVKLVVDHAIHIVLVGLVPAVLLASLGTRFLTSTVGTFLPGEIAPWVQVPILMLVAGVIAAYVPARRASRVDPNVALRAE
jgi:predicted permease